jgi:hypothetical protein
MLTKVYDNMADEARKILNLCQHAWQARIRLHEILHSNLGNVLMDVYGSGKLYGKYDKFILTKETPSLNFLDYKNTQVTLFKSTGKKKATRTKLFEKLDKVSRQLAFEQIKADVNAKSRFLYEIEFGANVLFVLNDLGKGAEKYINAFVQGIQGREYADRVACDSVYMFSVMAGKHQMKRMRKEFEKALGIIGNPPFMLASDIKERNRTLVDAPRIVHTRERVTGVLKATGTGRAQRYSSQYSAAWRKYTWSRVAEENIPTGIKLYVPVQEFKVVNAVFEYENPEKFISLLSDAKLCGLFPLLKADTDIFGLTEKAIGLATDNPEWVNVLDYIADNAQDFITDAKVLELSIYLEPFRCSHNDILRAVLEQKNEFSDSPLVEFAEKYFAAQSAKREKQAAVVSSLTRSLAAVNKYKRGETVNFKSLWRAIVLNHYPILGFSFGGYSSDIYGVSYKKSVLEYIRLMDTQKKVEETI